ncbi:MAG TPA: carbonic anhydrase [Solirubrobacterales bacterium]|nr:carbonic anhydrase [Solirubrobacterales bacterium]
MNPGNRRTAIVTCMDARLDAADFLDLWPATVHVIRNAGGRVTADVLRSLVVSSTMEIERVAVVHHTRCAMAERTDEELRSLLPPGVDLEIDFLTIADPLETLRHDVHSIRSSPLLPSGIEVNGFIYDLDARVAHEIEIDRETWNS